MRKAYLLTGGPGVGKTTIIKRALEKAQVAAGDFSPKKLEGVGLGRASGL